MLATMVDTLNIPPLWYPVVRQIQSPNKLPNSSYLDTLGRGFRYVVGASSTVSACVVKLPEIEQLGWSAVEALETYLRFRSFADDWDAPGMEAYDVL